MAVPSVIASAVNRNSGGSGICSTAFTVQTGDLILVASIAYETLFASRLPTDTQSNTYGSIVSQSSGTRTMGLAAGVCGSSGSLTVTQNITSTGNDLACLFIQIRGQHATYNHLSGLVTDQASSTSWSLNLANTTVADCLVVGAFGTIGTFGTFSGSSGWTAFGSQSSDPGITGCYASAATAGAYDPAGTVGSSQSYSAVGMAVIGAAAESAASLVIQGRTLFQSHLVR